MTREEEIRDAADAYYMEVKYMSDLSGTPFASFIAGAKWSDEHPRKGLIDVDKACEWLSGHLDFLSTYYDDEFIEDIDRSDIIKYFRKAMGEGL